MNRSFLGAVAILASLALLAPAQAVPENDAAAVDPRVVAVGHAPEVPAPGTQWTGFIELKSGHNFTHVYYQICNVGKSCFDGGTLAIRANDNRWEFDTAAYALGFDGEPVPWGINRNNDEPWLVGVKYFLASEGQTLTQAQVIPEGRDDCQTVPYDDQQGWIDCDATHYFTFAMPGAVAAAPGNEAPGLPLVVLVGLLVWAARRK
jgi:hypothetical protein